MNVRAMHLLSAVAFIGLTQPVAGQDEQVRSRVDQAILSNCEVAPPSAAQAAVVTPLGTDALPFVAEAFENGPSEEHVEEMREAAARRHEMIQRLIDAGRDFGLSDEQVARLRETAVETYVESVVTDFRFAYGDAALRIAADIGGSDSEAFLRRVARDPASEHSTTARDLLSRQNP